MIDDYLSIKINLFQLKLIGDVTLVDERAAHSVAFLLNGKLVNRKMCPQNEISGDGDHKLFRFVFPIVYVHLIICHRQQTNKLIGFKKLIFFLLPPLPDEEIGCARSFFNYFLIYFTFRIRMTIACLVSNSKIFLTSYTHCKYFALFKRMK